MAIINSYDLLEDVDTDDTSKLLEKIAKKKAEEAAAALAAEAKKIAELREAAEKEDAERVAEGSYFKAPIVKETAKRAIVPSRGGDIAHAQGNRGNGSRRNSGQNVNVNSLSGDSKHNMRDGIDNNVKGSGVVPQVVNDNGSVGGDIERPHRRQSEKRRNKADDKPNADNVVTEEPVNTAKTEHNTINSEEVKKAESIEFDANKAKEEEEKLMTLDDYEKIVEEKRKRLLATRKVEERKVDLSKEFESMQQLSLKKGNDEIFFKLASDKDGEKGREVGKSGRGKKIVQGTKQGSDRDGEKKDGKVKKVVTVDDIFTVKRERYRRQYTEGYEGQRSSPAASSPSESQGKTYGTQESIGISGGQRSSFGARSNDNQGNGRSDSQNFRGYGGQRNLSTGTSMNNQARDGDDLPHYKGGRRAQAISLTPSLENPTDFPPLKAA